jgi:hypothetical protein
LYDLEVYIIDRVWFMINFGESHSPLAPPILEIWIFEILKIRTLKSNNSRSIIFRIYWFAYYCSLDISEQESIKKSGGVWWTLTNSTFRQNKVINTEWKNLFKKIVFKSCKLHQNKEVLSIAWRASRDLQYNNSRWGASDHCWRQSYTGRFF